MQILSHRRLAVLTVAAALALGACSIAQPSSQVWSGASDPRIKPEKSATVTARAQGDALSVRIERAGGACEGTFTRVGTQPKATAGTNAAHEYRGSFSNAGSEPCVQALDAKDPGQERIVVLQMKYGLFGGSYRLVVCSLPALTTVVMVDGKPRTTGCFASNVFDVSE